MPRTSKIFERKLERKSSINQTIKKCVWVLKPATENSPAVYCEKYTDWKMVLDEDGNRVRDYFHFCNKHQDHTQPLEEEE